MNLLSDYFAALGRVIAGFGMWLAIVVVRLLALIVWCFAASGVILSYRVSAIVGGILTVVFLLATGFVVYVFNRRRAESEALIERERPQQAMSAPDGGGGVGSFIVKVIIALIIVVIFIKYFVQVRLVPETGH